MLARSPPSRSLCTSSQRPTPQDDSHVGANPGRNGLVGRNGPRSAAVLWDVTDPSSTIAWFTFWPEGDFAKCDRRSGSYGMWTGEVERSISPPAGAVSAMAGDTRFFQVRRRGSGPMGATTDFTSAVSVTLF